MLSFKISIAKLLRLALRPFEVLFFIIALVPAIPCLLINLARYKLEEYHCELEVKRMGFVSLKAKDD